MHSASLTDPLRCAGGQVVDAGNPLHPKMPKGNLHTNQDLTIKSDSFVPYTKKQGDSIMAPAKLIPNNEVGDVLSANAEMSRLFTDKVFSYPKPVTLIKYLIHYFDDTDFYVLDFFSGSATTAQAVMNINSETEKAGRRKYILIQLPEILEKNENGSNEKEKNTIRNAIDMCNEFHLEHTICSIAEERIRRAGKKIREETGADIDYGFRCFRVDSSNMKDVYYRPDVLKQDQLDLFSNNIKEDRTPEDLLIQVMLDLGVLLSSKVKETEIAGKKVFSVADGYLIACFDRDVTEDVVTAIAKQYPFYAVFRDSSMAYDSVAANFEQIFDTYSPQTVRKVL